MSVAEWATMAAVSKFDLTTRKTEAFVGRGEQLRGVGEWRKSIVPAGAGQRHVVYRGDSAARSQARAIELDAMEAYVDPRSEWNQMSMKCGESSGTFFMIRIFTD